LPASGKRIPPANELAEAPWESCAEGDAEIGLLQKRGGFLNRLWCNPHVQPPGEKALSRIRHNGSGWLFSTDEFRGVGDPRFVGMALTRLMSEGTIRRLARGLCGYLSLRSRKFIAAGVEE
jgi:hypothetical protein